MNAQNAIPDRIANALRQFPPFSMFDEYIVRDLACQASVRVLTSGDAVWEQGDPPGNEVLFLARGRVEYFRNHELIDVRDVGDILGLSAQHEAEPYRVTALAAEDSILYTLPWLQVREIISINDQARYYVRRHLFWGTRVGRSLPESGLDAEQNGQNLLEAHIKGAQTIQPRPAERLLCCPADTPIRTAARMMSEKRLPSILITDSGRKPIGILTGSDLVQEVIVGARDSQRPVSDIMSGPVITVARNSSAAAAALIMLRERIGQVCVTEDGTPETAALDVCTQKDLLAQSGRHPAGFIHEIRMAQSPVRFREICDDIERMVHTYLEAGISGLLLGEICAELYDELIRNLINLSLAEMSEEGRTPPEAAWTWIAVGSDGRREQVLRTDMDNGMIFASSGDKELDDRNRIFFIELAGRVINLLVEAGFSRCQGGVMASNPNWCKTDAEWIAELQAPDLTADGEGLLRALILYDLRYVAGDKTLSNSVRRVVFSSTENNQTVKRCIAEMIVATPPPLNFRGKFVVEKKGGNEGRFDIKKRGLVPLRDAARLFALHYGLSMHHSTGGRWLEMAETHPEKIETAMLARQGYDLLLRIRTLAGITNHDSGRFVDPDRLTKLQRGYLVNVFDVQRMVQAAVRVEFGVDLRS
jgi:CBS domain-containing protein